MLKNIINHLPYFSCVGKNLSFSLAAQELFVSQSAISYQIKSLEEKLGFTLFLRGQGSKVELSYRGEQLYQEYALLERNFNQVLSDTQLNESRSTLEITTPIDFGVKLLTPILSSFETDNLFINLDLNDEIVAFKKSRFDFSIRNNTDEVNLEYLDLIDVKNIILCSQNYAKKHDFYSMDNLNENHRLIVRNASKSKTWENLFKSKSEKFITHQNKQIINNSFGILQAVNADAGIAILPEYFIDNTNRNNLHLLETPIISTTFYLAYQPSYISKKWASKIKKKIIAEFKLRLLTV
jgi:DNA-binding transcriptional LysR family regulator